MILAWAHRPPGTLPCYTWGGTYRDCADVKIARRTAKISHQPHKTILVGDDFLSQFPELAERAVYISDGTMDVTGSIDLYVQRLARQIAPVRASGVCGGEILRRLVAFKPGPPQQGVFDPGLECSFGDAAATYADELQGRGFPSLPSSKRRGIWRANLPWNDHRSHIERLILITIWLLWPIKRRRSYCTKEQRFGSLPMATQPWEDRDRSWYRLGSLPGTVEYCIVTRSSPLKQNTPMIIACLSGWPGLTMPLHHFT